MGWMRTLFLGDIGNRLDIGDNENQIRRMKRDQRRLHGEKSAKDQSQDLEIARLRTELDDVQVALSMISTMLVSKGVLTQEELGRLVDSIESDGD